MTNVLVKRAADGTTRKSPQVQFRSANHHITDISSWLRGRSANSFLTNTDNANSAPRFALQVTHFSRVTRFCPLGVLNGATFVFD